MRVKACVGVARKFANITNETRRRRTRLITCDRRQIGGGFFCALVTRKRRWQIQSPKKRTITSVTTKRRLIASARISRSISPRANRTVGNREDGYSPLAGERNVHASHLIYREIHPETICGPPTTPEGAFAEATIVVFVPVETVSSCHLSVLRLFARATEFTFRFPPRGKSRNEIPEISEARLVGIFILLLENTGMDAPATHITSR